MKKSILSLAMCVAAAFLSLGAFAQDSGTVEQVRHAYEKLSETKQLELAEFKTIFNWLTADLGREKWRKIDWRHDLMKARRESAKLDKPIFIWAMNGDPLGCV